MKFSFAISIVIALASSAQASFADEKPEPSVAVSGEEIGALFNSKTWEWSDGYAFFEPGGRFTASRNLRESAEGVWYAKSSGKICAQAIWRTILTKSDFARCWIFAKDSGDQLWMSSSDDPLEWYPFDPKTEFVSGYVAKAEFDYARIKRVLVEAEIVDGKEIAQLFFLKSWIWKDGIAYFGNNGTFRATLNSGSIAEGGWRTAKEGELCYRAQWTTPEGISDRSECWLHARDNQNRLWQRQSNDPEGWYLFDPKSALIRADIGNASFMRNKRRLGG